MGKTVFRLALLLSLAALPAYAGISASLVDQASQVRPLVLGENPLSCCT